MTFIRRKEQRPNLSEKPQRKESMNASPLVSRQAPAAAGGKAERASGRPERKTAAPVKVRGIATELPPELLGRSESEPGQEPQRLCAPMVADGI